MNSCSPAPEPKHTSGCGPAGKPRLDTLVGIVAHYLQNVHASARARLAFYRDQPSLDILLAVVASWERHDGKIEPHQRRMARRAKEAAGERIRALELGHVTAFPVLFAAVERAIGSIPGVGELAVYDVALRIGAHLGHLPDRVYVQAGVRKAVRYLGLPATVRSLSPDVFPDPLRALEPWHLENLLCIYKGHLRRLAGSKPATLAA